MAKINGSTSVPEDQVGTTIGLLDIFGFESFTQNRFEQLCINFANEKLQQKFTQDVFRGVQEEYAEEGIPWKSIEFVDNVETLALIEARMGIFAVLNEECQRPMGNDDAFASKLGTLHAKHADFSVPRVGGRGKFTVRHYAGSVTYTADGFLDSNKDTLSDDLAVSMAASDRILLADLFKKKERKPSEEDAAPKKGGRKKGGRMQETVSTKFKIQLRDLMTKIESTSVQYVRCIKPNPVKSSTVFAMKMVLEQLRCAGVVEAIRISRSGFPNRMAIQEFVSRFGLLGVEASATKTGACWGGG